MGKLKILFAFPCHNRLEYNKITLPAMMYECKTSDVTDILIIDDDSSDGTSEYIGSLLPSLPSYTECDVVYARRQIGSSVGVFRVIAEFIQPFDYVINICNDTLLPSGGLQELISIIDEGKYSGISPRHVGVIDYPRIVLHDKIVEAQHITCGIYDANLFKGEDLPVNSIVAGERRWVGQEHFLRSKGGRYGIAQGVEMLELDRSALFSRSLEYERLGYARLFEHTRNVKSLYNYAKDIA